MRVYLCQMVDYDDEEDWTKVEAYDAEAAAGKYAELCDSRSAGEVFNKQEDTQIILVKTLEHKLSAFNVTFEYMKVFYMEENEDGT